MQIHLEMPQPIGHGRVGHIRRPAQVLVSAQPERQVAQRLCPGVEWNGDRVTLSGEIEIIDRFQRSYGLVRTPLPLIAPVVRNRAAPECRYVVIDDKNRVVLADVALPGDGATFRIDLGGRLPAGNYTMFAVIALNGNVMNADIRQYRSSFLPVADHWSQRFGPIAFTLEALGQRREQPFDAAVDGFRLRECRPVPADRPKSLGSRSE